METFTSQQVIDRLSERYRLFNRGSKAELIDGLTMEQIAVLGDLMLALNHRTSFSPISLGAKVGKSYPKVHPVCNP